VSKIGTSSGSNPGFAHVAHDYLRYASFAVPATTAQINRLNQEGRLYREEREGEEESKA
jgi:hypothetical protein